MLVKLLSSSLNSLCPLLLYGISGIFLGGCCIRVLLKALGRNGLKILCGTGEIISRNYKGDGLTATFDFGIAPVKGDNLFVKVNGVITASSDYKVSYSNATITFNTAPSLGVPVSILNIGNSATNILDIDAPDLLQKDWRISDNALFYLYSQSYWRDKVYYACVFPSIRILQQK